MKKESNKNDLLINTSLAGAAGDVVDRYGSATNEHFIVYSGVNNETGQTSKRSLKGISQSAVNPEFRDQNLKQQAGFAAETKEVARRRAEEAISGKKPTTVRTDDIPGHVNDPLFDITSEIDANGNPVPGSSMQMKFVGATPKDAVSKMLGKDYQKYIDNDCRILVPSDYFNGMKEELTGRIETLKTQIASLKQHGNIEAAAQKQALLDKCQKLRDNLEKSSVSTAEAMEARTTPGLSTAKDVLKIAHRAGVEQAKMGAAIGGSISLIQNAMAYFEGKKEGKEALTDVAKDTAAAAALSYGTGAAGSLIKACMQNSKNSVARSLSKSNLPAYIATAALEIGKTFNKYIKKEINGEQFREEFMQKGFGMLSGATFSTIGQVAIPIPIVGALAGNMIGYALSSAVCKTLIDSLREAKLARERKIALEKQRDEAIRMLKMYRQQLEEQLNNCLTETREFFDATFREIEYTLQLGDIDEYIAATKRITEAFGGTPQFSNMAEFETLMASNDPIIL